jgi:hypothetical protein
MEAEMSDPFDLKDTDEDFQRFKALYDASMSRADFRHMLKAKAEREKQKPLDPRSRQV